MAYEIERKFLVCSGEWRSQVADSMQIRQAYLAANETLSVRVRLVNGTRATLSIKSRTAGLLRQEFEYEIPSADAVSLMELRKGALIEKERHRVPSGTLSWEIDVFGGENEGLIIAEIELEHADQAFERPDWLGDEVTNDERYYNFALAMHPARWKAGA